MKQIAFILTLFGLILIQSCGSDDGDGMSIKNQLSVKGTTYDVTHGAYVDLGTASGVTQGILAVSDGEVSIENNTFTVDGNSTVYFLANFAAVGNSLEPGEYSFSDSISGIITQAFYGVLISADGTSLEVTEGTIELSGTAPNFTMIFNISLKGGGKLTGSFKDTFTTN